MFRRPGRYDARVADPLSVTPDSFKAALSRWASGVTVVTAPGPAGMTVSAFASLSLEPPLITVAIACGAHAHDAIVGADGFAVHILGADHAELSTRFASPVDRFAGLTWEEGPHGEPLLHEYVARLVCARHATFDGGDHTILVGRVVQADITHGDPVLYYRGAYRHLVPLEDDDGAA